MKRIFLLSSAVAFMFIAFSCGNNGQKAETGDAKTVSVNEGELTLNVDPSNSTLEWEGSKPTGKHHGTINISKGEIHITDGNLVGGSFTIDMNSIVNLDLEDAESNGKLVGHLKSADFFDVEKFPTSTFEITSVQPIDGSSENFNVTGNLTIKETTASVTFPVTYKLDETGLNVQSSTFIIDRSVWSVKYGSRKFFDNLKDSYISDEISLKVTINAKVD